MKRSRKTVFALLLALVMTLGLAATVWATEGDITVDLSDGFIEQNPNDPMDPPERVYKIPFTKTVKLGGNTDPGTTDFRLGIFNIRNGNVDGYRDVTYTAAVTTNGAGSYDGELVISGPAEQIRQFVSEGFFVREVNDNLSGWTYSNAVWYVNPEGKIFLARMETTPNGESYVFDDTADAESKMTFENIYTENLTTVEIPFTKTVKLGGNTAPGTTDFTIAVCDVGAYDLSYYTDVTYKVVITTNGAGGYDGKLVISGPADKVGEFVSEGFFVREVNDNLSGWTYSDAVWHINANGEIRPAKTEKGENGEVYFREVDGANTESKMTFENTYTYNTSYTTPDVKPTSSPKTFDAGVALYGVSALLSLTGTALVIKRKNG